MFTFRQSCYFFPRISFVVTSSESPHPKRSISHWFGDEHTCREEMKFNNQHFFLDGIFPVFSSRLHYAQNWPIVCLLITYLSYFFFSFFNSWRVKRVESRLLELCVIRLFALLSVPFFKKHFFTVLFVDQKMKKKKVVKRKKFYVLLAVFFLSTFSRRIELSQPIFGVFSLGE